MKEKSKMRKILFKDRVFKQNLFGHGIESYCLFVGGLYFASFIISLGEDNKIWTLGLFSGNIILLLLYMFIPTRERVIKNGSK